jgi:hypothetical protein
MSGVDLAEPVFSASSWIASVMLGEPHDVATLSPADYKKIGLAATDHGVVPLLHHFLSPRESWDEFPEHFRELLSQHAHRQIAWDMLRENDLGQLLNQLNDAGINYILIKGAGLAYTHYPHSFLRDRCDTDILFADQAGFDRAWDLLESLGYARRNTLSGEFVGYQHCCHRQLSPGVHQVLDCHIRINDYLFFADALGFDELVEHSVALPQLAASARTLGPVHAMLMACLHRVATMPFGNADRLIWLFDIHLLGHSFDGNQWVEFLALARDRALCGSCVHSLYAANEHFPLSVPAQVMAELERTAAKELFKPGQEMKRWKYYLHALKSLPGWRNKARLLREHFLPSPSYLMEKYDTSNRILLPFLYVRRVLEGWRRYF